ncbi:MAG TPA: hypothetical protein VF831_01445, partial [Anaerolineales bacterium]
MDVALQTAELHVDPEIGHNRSRHANHRIHIFRSATAQDLCRGLFPLQELHGYGFSYLRRVVFPGILALVDQRLVILGLVARQVGEDAREGDLHQRPLRIVPLEFAEEVCCPFL